MISKKVCMVGAFGVGKTSLVARFVTSLFSDTYLSTVGVKVDKKQVKAKGQDVLLMLWDVAGEDNSTKLNMTYIKGASGYLLVIDRTRKASLDVARELRGRIEREVGPLAFVAAMNKSDVTEGIEVTAADIEALASEGWTVMETSAKSGRNVEEAFVALAGMLV